MASIRKRGGSYLLVVSMGYTPDGRRRNPQQKTVKPPTGLTPKQTEKWLQEQAMLFEMSCKKMNPDIDRSITLEKYTEIWLQTIAPDKLAKSTLVREKQDIERFKPYLGSYKLVDLRPEHFRSLYAKLRKQKNKATGKLLSEATVEGVHSCLCGILSDAMEGGYLNHNPAWRTYKYAGQKKEKKIADDETVKKLIQALEAVSILYETYFKLIIATGMRRGECCALKWEDIKFAFAETVRTSGRIFIVIGAAKLYTVMLTTAGFDKWVAKTMLGFSTNPTVILIMILLIFFIVTMFMESIATLTLFMPILYPIALGVGINPIVLSVLITVVIGIGLVTPPVGMCIYVACDLMDTTVGEVFPTLVPFIAATFVSIALMVAFPQLILLPTYLMA